MSAKQANQYMSRYVGPPIGSGTSRKVYQLGNNYVLKLLVNELDKTVISQMIGEIELYIKCKANPLLAKIDSFSQQGKWIVMERATTFGSPEEFLSAISEYFGMQITTYSDWETLQHVVLFGAKAVKDEPTIWDRFATLLNLNNSNMPKWLRRQKAFSIHNTLVTKPNYLNFIKLVRDGGFNPLDTHWKNWGRSKVDGRLVLIDYGYDWKQL